MNAHMTAVEIRAELRSLLDRKEAYAYGEAEYWQHDDDRVFELVGLLLPLLAVAELTPNSPLLDAQDLSAAAGYLGRRLLR